VHKFARWKREKLAPEQKHLRISGVPRNVWLGKAASEERETAMRSARLFRASVLAVAIAALLSAPGALAATTQMTSPFSDLMPDPCTGDLVLVTGTLHVAGVSNNNKAEVQTNWPDTRGFSLTREYQANDASHTFVFTTGPNAFTFGFSDSFELVSLDGASNFLVHEEVKINLLTMETTFTRGGMKCTPG
jgi:hypothetical protein